MDSTNKPEFTQVDEYTKMPIYINAFMCFETFMRKKGNDWKKQVVGLTGFGL